MNVNFTDLYKLIHNKDKIFLKIKDLIKNSKFVGGHEVEKFEKNFSKFVGSKYTVSLANGTDALEIAIKSLNIKKNSEVILPVNTWISTAEAVLSNNLKIVFCDINLDDYSICLKDLKKKISKKTKLIMPVHLYGNPTNVENIKKLIGKRNIKIIEDCAHSLGTKYRKKHVGNFGVSGCFSFYPTKQITTGEGGAIITNDIKFYKKIKSLKQFGIDKDITQRKRPGEYDVGYLGFNYRMTDFQAAMGYQQILNYNINLKKRQEIAKRYIKKLNHLNGITLPRFNKNDSYFVFQILIDKKIEKLRLMNILKNSKIGISVHYGKILPEMSYYKKKYNFNSKKFISAKNYADRVISLPVYPKLNNIEIDRITKILKNIFT